MTTVALFVNAECEFEVDRINILMNVFSSNTCNGETEETGLCSSDNVYFTV